MTGSACLKGLRFVQVIGDFSQGGDGRVARNLAAAIRDAGGESRCIALRSEAMAAESIRGAAEVGLGIGSWATAPRGLLALRRELKSFAPQVVHVHGPSSLTFVAAALLGMRARLWFSWHDSGSVAGSRLRSFRWAAGRCELLFGSSSQVSRRLSESLGGRAVSVLRNGVPEFAATAGMCEDEPVVVWAARWVPPKAPMALIHALDELRRRRLRFRAVIAGAGSDRYHWLGDELRAARASMDLEGVVAFPGWVSDIPSLCANAAIGVQTSLTEGLSLTLLEQAMAGLAIVATDVGDTREVIEHERTGLLVPPGDAAALTDSLARVVADRPLRARLGIAARERVLERFSLPTMAKQIATMAGRSDAAD
jgi:glycosyltransferase involved in cell wall biosynthesis